MDRQQVIAGIRLGKIIGAGAIGVVHAGTVVATGQQVAVKLVRPQPGQPTRLVERTVQEGRVGWAVRHPNVVRVYEWGMAEGGAAYIVMERLEGETLAQQLLARGRLRPDEVVGIARYIARGLAAIHAQGGVHRDIKPENVFLCAAPEERVKLLDLGIVHLGEDHPARLVRTGVGLIVGTLGYLSPEQARGNGIDARSDLYGLGATLYHALVGQPPHPEGDVVETLRHIALMTEAPPLPDDVPEPLAKLVRWMLAPEPDARPPDAAAVLDAIDQATPAVEEDDDTGQVEQVDDAFPAMDEIAGHRQIRAGIIAAVARAIRSNGAPPQLAADLAALDRLKDRRRAAAVRAHELRRQATELADELDDRRRSLEDTHAQLEGAQAEVRERYMQSTAALMEIADSIEDIDRRYLRHYEQLDELLSDDPAAANGPARSVPHCLAEMEALHQSRAFFADSQASVRTRLRTQHRAVSGINLQVIEIKRELLAVEAERQATLVGLEDAQRTADDEVLKLDREIEHQFLRLGFIVQAHHARVRMQLASPVPVPVPVPEPVAEVSPEPTPIAETPPSTRGMRIVGRLSRRSISGTAPTLDQSEAAAISDRISANRQPRPMPGHNLPPEPDPGLDTAPHDPIPEKASNDVTAPQDIPSMAELQALHELDEATSPERLPPSRRGDTAEIVSPQTVDRTVLAGGALIRDRISRPPPLPPEVWTSAEADADRSSESPTDPDVGDGPERRLGRRVKCSVRVQVDVDGDRALLTSRDLGVGGVFIFAPRLHPPGTELKLVLHLGEDRVPLDGQVVYGLNGMGYGVRFENTPDAVEEQLARFVGELAEST